MANTILTPTAVTREALRILHQKLNFVGNINRSYDASYAKDGAKIGTDLKIRLPNQYTVRTGASLSTQDTTETSTTLTVSTQKGVDTTFTSQDLTLSLDDFSQRILQPAMSVLAANIESDALSMYKDVYNIVGAAGTVPNTALTYLQGKQKLDDCLAPDSDRSALLAPVSTITIVDALKGLFQSSNELSKQYIKGRMNEALGFEWYQNTMMPTHTLGTQVAASMTVNGASQTGATLNVNCTNGATVKKGTVITLASVFRVHPETKVTTSVLQQFTVTADVTFGAATGSIGISPSIVTSGATQNVSASPADTAVILYATTPTVSTGYVQNLLFQKDAFTFATADLVMPKGVHFAAREVLDGISMRIVQQYAISTDTLPCRIDVLYGYKTIRPELACRVTN